MNRDKKKTAVIIGASSGIGRALAQRLHAAGYCLGLAARRVEKLTELNESLGGEHSVRALDVTENGEAVSAVSELFSELGGADLFVISAGTGDVNRDLEWPRDRAILNTNVIGFAAMANTAFNHFSEQGHGHIVGITSIAGLRGARHAPAYNASKAFESVYLEGLRHKSVHEKKNIVITDIQPGFVDTAMAKGDGLFWVASPDTAARQILRAVFKKRRHTYITRRWRLAAWVLKLLPDWIYYRL